MTDVFIGIDPGASGAVALITPDEILVEPYPGDIVAAAALLRTWCATYLIRMAAVERVSSRPGQGVCSVFTFGQNFGGWLGILSALGIPHVLPTPAQWQRGIIVPSDGPDTKSRSLAVARRLFPNLDLHRKGDHGKADALLLATYARKECQR